VAPRRDKAARFRSLGPRPRYWAGIRCCRPERIGWTRTRDALGPVGQHTDAAIHALRICGDASPSTPSLRSPAPRVNPNRLVSPPRRRAARPDARRRVRVDVRPTASREWPFAGR